MMACFKLLGLGTLLLFSLLTACAGKDPDVSGALPDAAVATTGGQGGTGGGTLGGIAPTLGGGPSGGGTTPSAPGGIAGGMSTQQVGTPFHQDDTGMAQLEPATLDGLRRAPRNCAAPLIYPYDGTVFPGGLISPPFMWQGAADAVYLRARYENSDVLDYQFARGASNPGEVRIPQERWAEIARRAGTNNLLVTVNVKSGASLSSCEIRLRIARGNMVGALYYNTYNHPEAGGVGAVLRLTLGSTAPPQVYLRELLGVPPAGPCISCHSVSANGSTLAASSHLYFPAGFSASAYATGPDPQPAARADIQDAAFGAITPDGKAILRMGNPDCTEGANAFPRSKNNFPLAVGPTEAGLIDTASGQAIASSGLDRDHYMWMPQFSPDGRLVVFNDAKPDGSGGTDRRELAIMDYDPDTHAFSRRRTIVSRDALRTRNVVEPSLDYSPDPILIAALGGLIGGVYGTNLCTSPTPPDVGAVPGGSCTGPCYPAWPFFTPDGKGVVFSLISEPDFAVAFPGRDKASQSELWYADLPTGTLLRLDKANKGLKSGDTLVNYYPTVLPVQVGGYFWVFWTSTRDFGHRNISAPPEAVATDILFGSSSSSEAFRKRIWVSAIRPTSTGELGGPITTDPSFPGFYLEGQSDTGNTRAFAALNPCKAVGNTCTSGLDCCTGFCNLKEGAASGMCVEKTSCAKTNEKCTRDADCCPPTGKEPANSCIGGYCGFIELQ